MSFTPGSDKCQGLAPHSLYLCGSGPRNVQGYADSKRCLWKGVFGILTKSSCSLHREVPSCHLAEGWEAQVSALDLYC